MVRRMWLNRRVDIFDRVEPDASSRSQYAITRSRVRRGHICVLFAFHMSKKFPQIEGILCQKIAQYDELEQEYCSRRWFRARILLNSRDLHSANLRNAKVSFAYSIPATTPSPPPPSTSICRVAGNRPTDNQDSNVPRSSFTTPRKPAPIAIVPNAKAIM